MFIYEKNKLIFQHVPKAAGKSIRLYLKDIIGKPNSTGPQHMPLKYCYDNKYDNYKMFAIIRNPYERLCSFYEFRKNKFITGDYNKGNEAPQKAAFEMNFDQWIREWVIPKSKSKTWYNDTSISNSLLINGELPKNLTIIKLEELNKLYGFLIDNGVDVKYNLPHKNKGGKRKHWSTYFDEELKEIIYQWDKFVFDNFYQDLKGETGKCQTI